MFEQEKKMKNNNKREEILENVQRVVVKVGTSTLTTEDGRLNIDKIKKNCNGIE